MSFKRGVGEPQQLAGLCPSPRTSLLLGFSHLLAVTPQDTEMLSLTSDLADFSTEKQLTVLTPAMGEPELVPTGRREKVTPLELSFLLLQERLLSLYQKI